MSSRVKIILIMMVKNESKILERAINSTLSIIDGLFILDTGSTDNTVEIAHGVIERIKKERGGCFIGGVETDPFVNFGVSRSKSFELAKTFLIKNEWDLDNTFGLLLDADMVLKIDTPDTVKKHLEKYDNAMLYQIQHQYKYFNIRFIKMSRNWKCIGVTHEHWNAEDAVACVVFENNIWIDDISDGGCKSDKFERDIRLLETALKDEPNNSRYYFFLGQSYMCINKAEKSIEYYKKCATAEVSNETAWFALCMISKQYILMGDIQNAIKYCNIATDIKPHRSEPLYEMAAYYLSVNDLEKVDEYVNRGVDIPKPERDIIYVDGMIYGYGFRMLEIESMIRRRAKFSTRDIMKKFDKIRNSTLHDKPVYMDDLIWKFSDKLHTERVIDGFEKITTASIAHNSQRDEYVLLKDNNRLIYLDSELKIKKDLEVRLQTDVDTLFERNNKVWYASRKPTPELGTVNILTGVLIPDKIDKTDVFLGDDVPATISAFQRVLPVIKRNDRVTGIMQVMKPGFDNSLFIIASRDCRDGVFTYTTPFYLEDINGNETVQAFTSYGEDSFMIVYTSKEKQKAVVIRPTLSS